MFHQATWLIQSAPFLSTRTHQRQTEGKTRLDRSLPMTWRFQVIIFVGEMQHLHGDERVKEMTPGFQTLADSTLAYWCWQTWASRRMPSKAAQWNEGESWFSFLSVMSWMRASRREKLSPGGEIGRGNKRRTKTIRTHFINRSATRPAPILVRTLREGGLDGALQRCAATLQCAVQTTFADPPIYEMSSSCAE